MELSSLVSDNVKNIVLLDKRGYLIESYKNSEANFNSGNTYPVIVESYIWDLQKQHDSAEIYKDKIERVYDKESVPEETKVMLQDDDRRMVLIKTFNYGAEVLEVGCSQGTASIKIAELPDVIKVHGIDIRQSAIDGGKQLIKNLVTRGEIAEEVAKKIELEKVSIEELSIDAGIYDSICAYEVFEHMAPQDLLPAFQNLYHFIKKDGKFFISVPNRFPHQKYDEEKRSRWDWYDHRNFFSRISLEIFLSSFFEQVTFYPLYDNESIDESIYLIAECQGKKYD